MLTHHWPSTFQRRVSSRARSWSRVSSSLLVALAAIANADFTTLFLEGPTSTVGIRATRLTKPALEASLFERPAVRPPEALDSKVNQPEGSRK